MTEGHGSAARHGKIADEKAGPAVLLLRILGETLDIADQRRMSPIAVAREPHDLPGGAVHRQRLASGKAPVWRKSRSTGPQGSRVPLRRRTAPWRWPSSSTAARPASAARREPGKCVIGRRGGRHAKQAPPAPLAAAPCAARTRLASRRSRPAPLPRRADKYPAPGAAKISKAASVKPSAPAALRTRRKPRIQRLPLHNTLISPPPASKRGRGIPGKNCFSVPRNLHAKVEPDFPRRLFNTLLVRPRWKFAWRREQQANFRRRAAKETRGLR